MCVGLGYNILAGAASAAAAAASVGGFGAGGRKRSRWGQTQQQQQLADPFAGSIVKSMENVGRSGDKAGKQQASEGKKSSSKKGRS